MRIIVLLYCAALFAEEPPASPFPISAEERDRVRVLQIGAYEKLSKVDNLKLELLKAENEFAVANAKILDHVRVLYRRLGVNDDVWQLTPALEWERVRVAATEIKTEAVTPPVPTKSKGEGKKK